MQSKHVHVQEIKWFSLPRQRRLGRMCPVGRTKRDDAPSEPSDWYSDGVCVQYEPFATLRMAARTNVRREHLSCHALRVLFWLVGSLLSEFGKHWNCRQILLKCSCQRVRWFWSCYRQRDAVRLVGALLQPFAFKASTNISRRFCANCLKLVWYCCSPRNMLELSTARHVFVEVMAPEYVEWIFRTLIGTDKKRRGTHPSRLTRELFHKNVMT